MKYEDEEEHVTAPGAFSWREKPGCGSLGGYLFSFMFGAALCWFFFFQHGCAGGLR